MWAACVPRVVILHDFLGALGVVARTADERQSIPRLRAWCKACMAVPRILMLSIFLHLAILGGRYLCRNQPFFSE
jgi:hypothetical protein